MELTNECNSWRCYLHHSSRRNVNLGMESLEKKLMKKLLALSLIALLLTGCANDTEPTPTDHIVNPCPSYDPNDMADPCWQPPYRRVGLT